MVSPYSQALRVRVLASVDAGMRVDAGMSKMTAHRTFRVSRSTIDHWIVLRAQTGSVEAKTKYRRGKAPALCDREAFALFVERHIYLLSVTAAAL